MKVVRAGEWPALVLSFLYFLSLLASYYVMRPVRDGLVAGLGTNEIKYLITTVFIVMLLIAPLFGFLMTHIPRRTLLPAIYIFFVVNLIAFASAFATPTFGSWPARVFYVWLTVFNMFVVSVFWSVMADIWEEEQGRRLFGIIAAAGSVGGLLGPLLPTFLVHRVGVSGITLVAAALLSGTVVCLVLLRNYSRQNTDRIAPKKETLHGSPWQGIELIFRSPFLLGIAAIVLIGSGTAQFFYTETARLAKDAFATPEARTAFFANLDLWTNMLALIFQSLVVGPLTTRFGVVVPLVALAVVGFFAYGALAISPTLGVLAVSNVVRRSAEFGLGKPARDMLYTVATPQEKYLAKNWIDTVITRSGDLLGGWLYSGLILLGVTLGGLGAIAAAIMIGAMWLAYAVAQGYRRRGGK